MSDGRTGDSFESKIPPFCLAFFQSHCHQSALIVLHSATRAFHSPFPRPSRTCCKRSATCFRPAGEPSEDIQYNTIQLYCQVSVLWLHEECFVVPTTRCDFRRMTNSHGGNHRVAETRHFTPLLHRGYHEHTGRSDDTLGVPSELIELVLFAALSLCSRALPSPFSLRLIAFGGVQIGGVLIFLHVCFWGGWRRRKEGRSGKKEEGLEKENRL